LASSLDAKLCLLSSDVEALEVDINWLSAEAAMAKERQARKAIRKLTVKKELERYNYKHNVIFSLEAMD